MDQNRKKELSETIKKYKEPDIKNLEEAKYCMDIISSFKYFSHISKKIISEYPEVLLENNLDCEKIIDYIETLNIGDFSPEKLNTFISVLEKLPPIDFGLKYNIISELGRKDLVIKFNISIHPKFVRMFGFEETYKYTYISWETEDSIKQIFTDEEIKKLILFVIREKNCWEIKHLSSQNISDTCLKEIENIKEPTEKHHYLFNIIKEHIDRLNQNCPIVLYYWSKKIY